MQTNIEFKEPPLSRFLFASTKLSWLWLLIRLYVGWQWLHAGYEKALSPAWVGANSGAAVKGFLTGALKKTAGDHPDVQGWYAFFIEHVALNNTELLAHLITWGEIAVGVALILGVFTGIAAFFGSFMSMNFLFAGTLSINPLLFLLQLVLILAWRVAGWYGLDRFILPALGTPWQKGSWFSKS